MAKPRQIVAVLLIFCGFLILFHFTNVFQNIAILQNQGRFNDMNPKSWKEFQNFLRTYNKSYDSIEELQKRYNIFHMNYYWIEVQKQRNMNTQFSINHFADLSEEEFRQKYLGYKQDNKRLRNYANINEEIEIPDSVDWVEKGGVTPVKDQGECGSCWAFSAVAALECAFWQKTGRLKQFAEQELVDCSQNYGNYGCNGGLMDYAFSYWKQHSEELEADYPYVATDGTCKQTEAKGVTKISSYENVPTNEYALKLALSQQVISVAVDASNWQFYSGGIYDGSCSQYNLDHGVTLVGYGEDNGQKYWRIKNQWNTWWGEQGFIRLQRTDTQNSPGQCGIAAAASYPIL